MIVPALQIRSGKVVALQPDGEPMALPEEPVELARQLARYGEVAVLDLDAALEEGDNFDLVREICRVAECRVGGGIRDEARADALLRAGARRLVVGTGADEELLSRFPRARILVAMDIKDGLVMRRGWQEATDIDPVELALRLRGHCDGFVYTLVGHRTRMDRRELEQFEAIRARLPDHTLTAAAGFRSPEEVRDLDRLGVDTQLAVGELPESLDLAECAAAIPDFEKAGGLLPVIVQDTAGQVVALHQTNEEGLAASLRSGQATYWSRVRGGLWVKGEGTGNVQDLQTVRISGNRDALLYVVEQTGAADSRGRYSAFDELSYNLHRIEHVLRRRQSARDPHKSYTSIMLTDREGVRRQILEEARALVQASSPEEVRWETADLVYFVLLNLVQEGVSLDDILKELRGRAGRRRS